MVTVSPFEGVVITGFGLASSAGCDPAETVAFMRRGVPGIRRVLVDGCLDVLMGRVDRLAGEEAGEDRALAFARWASEKAMDHGGIGARDLDPGRVTVVAGSSKGRIGNFVPPDCTTRLSAFDVRSFPGDTLGLEVARGLGLRGSTVLNYPAACATGIVCLIRAISALQHDEADVAIAGSAESAGRALLLSAFQNMGALAPDVMRPFHAKRRGFNPGEGGAMFVLEREADAKARGAKILARIAGWDQRSDAAHMTAADDSGEAVAYAICRTLERAGWTAADVQYINAHGTATALNDVVEGRAIRKVFGSNGPPVSAIKPFIGHLLGASSAVELAIVLAAARDGFLSGTPLLDLPDPLIPLHFVPQTGMKGNFNRILKLSLGFGGHIGVIALELPMDS